MSSTGPPGAQLRTSALHTGRFRRSGGGRAERCKPCRIMMQVPPETAGFPSPPGEGTKAPRQAGGPRRRALGGSASYRVAKNTLVKRAAADAGVQGLDDLLVGPTAIAFVTGEAVDAAKALRNFAKEHKGLVIKGGVMDGRPLTTDEVNR